VNVVIAHSFPLMFLRGGKASKSNMRYGCGK
jgi:hypothetical protein